jgi:hypothetical protein
MYAPAPRDIDVKGRTGILAYSFQLSDSGQFALVEYVADDPAAFKAIQGDASIQVSDEQFGPDADDSDDQLADFDDDLIGEQCDGERVGRSGYGAFHHQRAVAGGRRQPWGGGDKRAV